MNDMVVIGVVSGYFNPLHKGHLEYIHAAKNQVEYLVVIVNNDHQVKLKGSKPFMDEQHRMAIIKELRDVDSVMIAVDTDKHVCASLEVLRKKYPNNDMYFFNSGDRVRKENTVSAETEICQKLGIKYVAIPLPKIYSSSTLLAALS